ncbi:hypothetical protein SGRA_0304 [Saprospira grandis str. Lewin]|uniref:Uncharacterized protein n=1 Tax=Saprospira grandis (strain Lewin) TaxID=984262 RepID=H6L7L1_SAPGL|nr:hypothetical protein SGRA_0304 [Saprospira grandis str. Lewin]
MFLGLSLFESRYLKGEFNRRRKKPREKTKVVQKRRAKRAFWPSDGEQCGEAADQAKNLFFCAGPSRPASCGPQRRKA